MKSLHPELFLHEGRIRIKCGGGTMEALEMIQEQIAKQMNVIGPNGSGRASDYKFDVEIVIRGKGCWIRESNFEDFDGETMSGNVTTDLVVDETMVEFTKFLHKKEVPA